MLEQVSIPLETDQKQYSAGVSIDPKFKQPLPVAGGLDPECSATSSDKMELSDDERSIEGGLKRARSTESRGQKRARSTSSESRLWSISMGAAETILGYTIQDVIWSEQQEISNVIDLSKNKEDLQKVSEAVYAAISPRVEDDYPTELVLKTKNTRIISELLLAVVRHFRAKAKLTPDQLELIEEGEISINGVKGRMDYAIVYRPIERDERCLLFVEAKTEGPRHSLKQLFLHLEKAKRGNANLEV